jgi:hypothetical protein
MNDAPTIKAMSLSDGHLAFFGLTAEIRRAAGDRLRAKKDAAEAARIAALPPHRQVLEQEREELNRGLFLFDMIDNPMGYACAKARDARVRLAEVEKALA